ncbi:MAG: energy transducer TonB [Pseudomonadota bacterium]|nr:energy transducer TonB [Pseudomonadota bacterium]
MSVSGPVRRLKDVLTEVVAPFPYAPQTSADWDDRFTQALLIAAIIHVLFIFGLQFTAANPKLFENISPPIDVVLVNAKTKAKPLQADVLAQANLDGGGNVDDNRQAKSPLPAAERDQTLSAEAEFNARVQALEQKTKALMQQIKSDYQVPEQKPVPVADPRSPIPTPPTPAPLDLATRSLEMARLQARIDQQRDEYQKRPRRMFVGARAQEFTFAQYVEDWRIKVERVGNMNYPEAAKRNSLYGTLILTVNIFDNGEIESIQIERSSGSKVLDAAAMKIVEMSAPFPRFPEALRKKVDILGITRSWTFTRSDQLTTQ